MGKSVTPVYVYKILYTIICHFVKSRIGSGWIGACGGDGFAGGGGGRISVDVFSRHDDPKIFVHGEAFIIVFFFFFLY